MKNLCLFLLYIIPSVCLSQDKIYYNVLKTELGEDKLISTVNGEDFILVDEGCLYIKDVLDLTNNGFEDLILGIDNGCGGNCCGGSYQIITYDGFKFHLSEIIGWDYKGLKVFESSFGYFFEVEANSSNGIGQTNFCQDKVELYKLNDYKLELINETTLEIIPSIIEISTLNISQHFNREYPEKIYIEYDLNNDNEPDSIICSMTEWNNRYITLFDVYIHLNNKTKIEIPQSKRIGVLNSVTNGFHDLVINCDEILIWNGTEYIRK